MATGHLSALIIIVCLPVSWSIQLARDSRPPLGLSSLYLFIKLIMPSLLNISNIIVLVMFQII